MTHCNIIGLVLLYNDTFYFSPKRYWTNLVLTDSTHIDINKTLQLFL